MIRPFERRPFRPRGGDQTRINQEIRAPKVRLIDDEGNQLGVVDTPVAIQKAFEKELDLVEVSPSSSPPVCRIMDYGKYRYEQEKKKKIARKRQHVIHVKEVRFKVHIDDHDYQVKIKHIIEFLSKKNNVKVTLRFRGREAAYKEMGTELLNRVAAAVAAYGEIEENPRRLGNIVIMSIIPKR